MKPQLEAKLQEVRAKRNFDVKKEGEKKRKKAGREERKKDKMTDRKEERKKSKEYTSIKIGTS